MDQPNSEFHRYRGPLNVVVHWSGRFGETEVACHRETPMEDPVVSTFAVADELKDSGSRYVTFLGHEVVLDNSMLLK